MLLSDARKAAVEVMEKHGLLAEGWTFAFNNRKNAFGLCIRSRFGNSIELSTHLVKVNTPERVMETILHEVAHALAPAHAGHNWQWRAMCRKIGLSNPERCFSNKDTVIPQGKYTIKCKCANFTEERQRRPKHDMSRYRCPRCYNGDLYLVQNY